MARSKLVTVTVTGLFTGIEVHAYVNTNEVNATVEVVGIGTYTTPFSLELAPGEYTLNATYNDYSESKTVTVADGEVTPVVFTFAKKPPPPPPNWIWLLLVGGGIAMVTVSFFIKKKKKS